MVWGDHKLHQFNNVDWGTTNENNFYTTFNLLLQSFFPPKEAYNVFPQYNQVAGAIDFMVTHNAIQLPIFFVKVKVSSALDRISTHAWADHQMCQQFTAILDSFAIIPLPAVIGISTIVKVELGHLHESSNKEIKNKLDLHPGNKIQGAPRKKKKDQGLFFFKMGSGHGLSTYVSRHLSIYGNGTSISE